MEKIKDLNKVKLPDMGVLVEVIVPKRFIIAPDGTKDEDSYGKIIALHPNIKDVSLGDYVIKYNGTIWGYAMGKGTDKERTFGIMYRSNMMLVVSPDNFIDPDELTNRVSI